MSCRVWPWLAALIVALGVSSSSAAPELVKVDDEFQVNTTTDGTQYTPAVAALPDGGFVVVWASQEEEGFCLDTLHDFDPVIRCRSSDDCPLIPGDPFPPREDECVPVVAVFGQRFDATGQPIGEEFRVNSPGIEVRYDSPDVAAFPDGGFVVVWETETVGEGIVPPRVGILARLYDPSGLPSGELLSVSEFQAPYEEKPRVATDSGGDFIVVWEQGVALDERIRAKRFAQDGRVIQGEFVVSEPDSEFYGQRRPAVAVHSNGDFVVAWGIESATAVFGRRFFASGLAKEQAFAVDPRALTINAPDVDVCTDPVGGFVAVWEAAEGEDFEKILRAQRYGADGEPLGDTIVAGTGEGADDTPSLTCLPNGDFVVVAEPGVFARMHASDFTASAPFFIDQGGQDPDIALIGSAELIVVWATSWPGEGGEIRAQRLRLVAGEACAGDCNVDGSVSIDELVLGVNIATDAFQMSACPAIDSNHDERVTVDELIAAVSSALNGCPGA
jgi:hypothetical protein